MRWLAAGEPSLPGGCDWLSPREAGHLDTLRFTKRRTEFLLRRRTGKLAVAAALGLDVDDATLARVEILNRLTGAPYVQIDGDRAALDISLSDRAGWAVGLVDDRGGLAAGTLGIDLELVEPRSTGFVADFLTAAEQEYVTTRATDDDGARGRQPGVVGEGGGPEGDAGGSAGRHADRRGHPRRTAPSRTGGRHSRCGTVDGQVFPGWWRRDGVFLLIIAALEAVEPPAMLPGGADLGRATPIHSWVTNPLVHR